MPTLGTASPTDIQTALATPNRGGPARAECATNTMMPTRGMQTPLSTLGSGEAENFGCQRGPCSGARAAFPIGGH